MVTLLDYVVDEKGDSDTRELFEEVFGSITTFDEIINEEVIQKVDELELKLAKKKPKDNMIFDEKWSSEDEEVEEILDEIPASNEFLDNVSNLIDSLSHMSDVEVSKLISFFGFKGNFAVNIHPKRVLEKTGLDFKNHIDLGLLKTSIILDKSAKTIDGKRGTQRLLRFPLRVSGEHLVKTLTLLQQKGTPIPNGLISVPTQISESLNLQIDDSLVPLDISHHSLGMVGDLGIPIETAAQAVDMLSDVLTYPGLDDTYEPVTSRINASQDSIVRVMFDNDDNSEPVPSRINAPDESIQSQDSIVRVMFDNDDNSEPGPSTLNAQSQDSTAIVMFDNDCIDAGPSRMIEPEDSVLSSDLNEDSDSQLPESQIQKSKRLLNPYIRYINAQRPNFKRAYPSLSKKELSAKLT